MMNSLKFEKKKDEASTIRRKKLDFDPLKERILWREHSRLV